ncbi:MAG: rRNA maturation RNase YbeY [Chroococcales cyanobacterium]
MQVDVHIDDYFFSQEGTNSDRSFNVNFWETWFSGWLEHLSSEYELPAAEAYELSLRLSDDEDIQRFNAQYRDQNKPTDVLSFAALEVDVPQPTGGWTISEPLYLGDILISVETASRQAQQQGHSLTVELAWLGAHGLLHLLGWDHPDEESLQEMLSTQETLLEVVGLRL